MKYINTFLKINDKNKPEQLNKSKADLIKAGEADGLALVEAGTIDAYQWFVNIRRLREFLLGVEAGLTEGVKTDIGNAGEYLTVGRAKIDLANSGDRLDYEKDPIYADLKKQMDARAELIKLATKKGVKVADPVHGDEVAAVPVKTFGKQVIKVQL